MNNEIINYKELAENWLANQNKALNPNEMQQFIMFCKMYRLNPWLKEAYPIVYNGQLQLITNYLVICGRAKQNPKYYRENITYWKDGQELKHPHLTFQNSQGVVVCVEIYDKENNLVSNYDWDIQENLMANKGSFKNNYFTSWVEKCAITNALRRTFPNEVQGLYIQEEFEPQQAQEPIQQVNVVKKEEEVKVIEPAKPKAVKKTTISPLFKKEFELLKKLESNPTARLNVVRDFCKDNGINELDLRDGNFNPTAWENYINNLYPSDNDDGVILPINDELADMLEKKGGKK